MPAIRITATYFETDAGGNAVPIFEAGKLYPVTEASQRQVARGNGEVVSVADDTQQQPSAVGDGEAAEKVSVRSASRATSARRQTAAAADVTSGF